MSIHIFLGITWGIIFSVVSPILMNKGMMWEGACALVVAEMIFYALLFFTKLNPIILTLIGDFNVIYGTAFVTLLDSHIPGALQLIAGGIRIGIIVILEQEELSIASLLTIGTTCLFIGILNPSDGFSEGIFILGSICSAIACWTGLQYYEELYHPIILILLGIMSCILLGGGLFYLFEPDLYTAAIFVFKGVVSLILFILLYEGEMPFLSISSRFMILHLSMDINNSPTLQN